ncbi:MAG: Clp protease N-terminal domain-containing protein, partial [Acidiferrobacterales bacterium]
MQMDKLTAKFQQALAEAQSLAVGRDHQFIEPLHVMAALLDQDGGTTRHLLSVTDINVDALRSHISSALEKMSTVQGVGGDIHISNSLGSLLNLTDKFAQKRGDKYISTELFVLAALEDKGELGNLLKNAGVSRNGIEKAIEAMRGGQKVEDANAEDIRQALDKYTIDLTER